MTNERNEKLRARVTKMVERAAKKEYNDDHLEDEDRAKLVALYREAFPEDVLPEDMTEAYVNIVS